MDNKWGEPPPNAPVYCLSRVSRTVTGRGNQEEPGGLLVLRGRSRETGKAKTARVQRKESPV